MDGPGPAGFVVDQRIISVGGSFPRWLFVLSLVQMDIEKNATTGLDAYPFSLHSTSEALVELDALSLDTFYPSPIPKS